MPQTPQTGGSDQSRQNRSQPQPDSLETDDRGTKPYQRESQGQEQTPRRAKRENPEDDPNRIGDPPPDRDDTIRAHEQTTSSDEGQVDNSDPPLTTDDAGDLGDDADADAGEIGGGRH